MKLNRKSRQGFTLKEVAAPLAIAVIVIAPIVWRVYLKPLWETAETGLKIGQEQPATPSPTLSPSPSPSPQPTKQVESKPEFWAVSPDMVYNSQWKRWERIQTRGQPRKWFVTNQGVSSEKENGVVYWESFIEIDGQYYSCRGRSRNYVRGSYGSAEAARIAISSRSGLGEDYPGDDRVMGMERS